MKRNVEKLLELFAATGTRATLFFLGDVVRTEPDLARAALRAGHEIGCHGLRHVPVTGRGPEEFRDDASRAKRTIEDAIGVEVIGFRAPCFLRGHRDLWALDVLADCGFRYDSSFLPLSHRPGPVPRLGPDARAVRLPSGLWEFPLPLTRVASGHFLPCAAGGFALRALPYAFTRTHLDRFNREVGPAVVYTHPWEIDPDSPKLPGTPAHVRFFNRIGRRRLAGKLGRLLRDFRFAPLREVYAEELAREGRPVGSPG